MSVNMYIILRGIFFQLPIILHFLRKFTPQEIGSDNKFYVRV